MTVTQAKALTVNQTVKHLTIAKIVGTVVRPVADGEHQVLIQWTQTDGRPVTEFYHFAELST